MTIVKHNGSEVIDYDLSILIPTWNNLDFIKNCLLSIEKNSALKIQPIVIINEGKDGTLEWIKTKNQIDYIYSETNLGICYALNIARGLVKSDYIVYANDDMYFLPDWDQKLMTEIKILGHNKFMLSATMIEPYDTGNPSVVVADYGKDLLCFEELKLLSQYQRLERSDWKGSTWPPNVVHKDTWDLVGGLSVEFSPGMYSDPDFSMKLYQAGVSHFKGIGNSLVYHFGSKSTKRVKKNKGRNTFILKWGITANYFSKHYLHAGEVWNENITKPDKPAWWIRFIHKIKRTIAIWL